MKKIIIYISLITLLLVINGCQKIEDVKNINSFNLKTTTNIDIGNDPYRLENMQQAINILKNEGKYTDKELKANKLYIKIYKPTDSIIKILENDSIILFNFPLHSTNNNLQSISDAPVYYYTVIDTGYQLPNNIDYELLYKVYIPNSEETDLEDASYKLTNNNQEPQTKGKYNPQGKIRVFNHITNSYEGAKNVGVVAFNYTHISKISYTNENGEFVIPSTFRLKVKYTMYFCNNDYKLWYFLSPALFLIDGWKYELGTKNFNTNERTVWAWLTIFNAAYDYKKYSLKEQIPFCSNLKMCYFYNGNNKNMGATLMLSKTGATEILKYSLAVLFGLQGYIVGQAFQIISPDVFFIFNNMNSHVFYSIIFHELAHASHSVNVNSFWWATLTEYEAQSIVSNSSQDPYLYGPQSTRGYCAIAESWAEGFSYFLLEKYILKRISLDLNEDLNFFNNISWIPAGIYYDLYDGTSNENNGISDQVDGQNGNVISWKKIFNGLTNSTKSVTDFKTYINSQCSGQSTQINNLFSQYNY